MSLFISRKKFDFEVSRQATEASDQIISELGAELHDDLIQKLSVFRLYLDRLERSSADQAEVESLTIKMRSEFEQVIHAVRSISRRLLPTPVEGDTFITGIELLCQNMQRPGTANIHFENEGKLESLTSQAEMHLFRIIQELIHNAFKHSAAWHIWVRMKWANRRLIIEVEDDGTGFAKIPEFIDRLKKKHNTLKMRTEVIGATINYLQGKKGLIAKIEYPF